MAKNKKKSQAQQKPPLSPELYMRRVMRTLPVDKCYINPQWQPSGMAHVLVVRRRPDGKFAMVNYLVDTFCLGVKDVMWKTRFEDYELESMLEHYRKNIDLEEIDYVTAHNIVYGAIAFAEEGGIEPCAEWGVGQYGLDEDTDDIPLVDFEFGVNGRHFLNTATRSEGMRYMATLTRHLGDNFDYEFEDDDEDEKKPYFHRYREEEYEAPDVSGYPETVELKHPEIEEILTDEACKDVVPVEQMERIGAIGRDELIADLASLARREIRAVVADDEYSQPLFHIAVILNSLADSRGLDTLLDIMRLNDDMLDNNFGDAAPEVMSSAIANCAGDRLGDIEAYLNEPGRQYYSRSIVLDAVDKLVVDRPEETIAIVRRQLESLPERVSERVSADEIYAGFVTSVAMNTGDRSLLPLIRRLYDDELVDEGACGPYSHVERDFGKETTTKKAMTMTEIYSWIRHFNEPYGSDNVKYGEPDYEHIWQR